MSKDVSPLAPVTETLADQLEGQTFDEKEKTAPWVVRKLAGSMTGRVVLSSYESLRAAGNLVACLSPLGDSSILLLPCIRFRDIAVHTVVVATGGAGIIAAPVLSQISAEVFSVLGDTILVELGLHAGFKLGTMAVNDLLIEHPLKAIIPIHSERLESTAVKVLQITLKYRGTMTDASLGFYRSSIHKDPSLFASVKDYLAIEKGWFSPYLFASGRRPIIPRSMKPDIVFCHGPFLEGDYNLGQTLLSESAMVIALCATPAAAEPVKDCHFSLDLPKMPSLTNIMRSRSPSPSEPKHALAAIPPPPTPRRMVILCVGIKPHRALWTTSARPSESVINYVLLNGCPAVVIPVKVGAPLVAWDALTLEDLWKVPLPTDETEDVAIDKQGKFGGIVNVLFEYLDLCVDWERVVVSGDPEKPTDMDGRKALKSALALLVASAIRSESSKEVKKEIIKERSGIAMWRIP
ncbi:hypothetical protein FB45DRAFT_789284 [Roridomyces roridus]|uniref:Uncharacterized protein n=1 Tax=Roridomyces roridus TaxID=1738132 RepID=A0AAD7FTX0_9AGAR|nr:hypothetical protein FB45DRAFT_789284 [Roridomyces roridus]